MKNPRIPYYLIIGGALLIIMSFTYSEGQVIPSWLKLTFGILVIAYGVFKLYKRTP